MRLRGVVRPTPARRCHDLWGSHHRVLSRRRFPPIFRTAPTLVDGREHVDEVDHRRQRRHAGPAFDQRDHRIRRPYINVATTQFDSVRSGRERSMASATAPARLRRTQVRQAGTGDMALVS